MKVYIDSSVLVSAIMKEHESGPLCRAVLKHSFSVENQHVIHEHGVLEAFSVLTRMPRPHRTPPGLAKESLDFYLGKIKVVSTYSQLSSEFLKTALEREAWGGTTYDLRHILVAEEEEVDQILTLNEKHFRRLWRGPKEIPIGL